MGTLLYNMGRKCMTKTIDLQIVDNVDNYIQNLSQLLMTCVDGGSSIGFCHLG